VPQQQVPQQQQQQQQQQEQHRRQRLATANRIVGQLRLGGQAALDDGAVDALVQYAMW
jgi:hypothetical protein